MQGIRVTRPETFARIRAALEPLLGCEASNPLEAYLDPHVADVYAVRVQGVGDFLIHADGDVEDCEFKQWPPQTHPYYD